VKRLGMARARYALASPEATKKPEFADRVRAPYIARHTTHAASGNEVPTRASICSAT
jgi:hypothetical protein